MIKIFLIGSCRIHRPFDCDNVNNYNALNLLGKYTFLGYMYNIKEIKEFVDLLAVENDMEKDAKLFSTIINPKFFTDPMNLKKQFKETRDAFQSADLVVMEISTSSNKTLTVHDGFVNEDEYTEIFKYLIYTLQSLNKKVLFVSHFNHNNNTKRQFIIDMCEKYLDKDIFFNPTQTILNNLPNSIVDNAHYSKSGESVIMNQIDFKIKKIFKQIQT